MFMWCHQRSSAERYADLLQRNRASSAAMHFILSMHNKVSTLRLFAFKQCAGCGSWLVELLGDRANTAKCFCWQSKKHLLSCNLTNAFASTCICRSQRTSMVKMRRFAVVSATHFVKRLPACQRHQWGSFRTTNSFRECFSQRIWRGIITIPQFPFVPSIQNTQWVLLPELKSLICCSQSSQADLQHTG